VPKSYLTFGTVLHACLERWASADASGRGADGRPVDPFPAGWETVEEKGVVAKVTPNEAALIRRLVEQAVERGIVQRGDGRVLEREIRLPVIEGVDLVGFIDVFVPSCEGLFEPSANPEDDVEGASTMPEIQDHKTYGEASVRFLKQPGKDSPNYVGADDQLLTYAAATSIIDRWDGPVVVRHNQFPKFAAKGTVHDGPRSVEAIVSYEELAAHWEKICLDAARMLQVRDVKRWEDVPGPYGSDVCQKYGGCPFREICGRRATLDVYRARIERRKAEGDSDRPNLSTAPRERPTPSMTNNDIFANARRRAAAPAAPTAPNTNPTPTAATAAKESSPVMTTVAPGPINGGVAAAPTAPALPAGYRPPPWANPACTACNGLGFNSKGRPCQICDALAKRSKRPTSSMYTVEGSMLDGFTAVGKSEKTADLFALSAPESWSSRGGSTPQVNMEAARAHVEKVTAALPALEAPKVVTMNVPIDAAEKQAATTRALIAGEAPLPPAAIAANEVAAEPAKRGRPKAGITILIGCAQMKGPDRPSLMAQQLLATLGAELAKDMGAASYWELDAFKRRDRIRQRSEQVAEALGKTVLLVPGVRDPDVDSLVASLLPHADIVIEGVR
jgi:hypothetical protein